MIATTNARFAQDRFGMVLNYYRGDYNRTGSFLNSAFPASTVPTNTDNLYAKASTVANAADLDLYNGNISSWEHSQLDMGSSHNPTPARADIFKYDVLNRIKQNIDKEQQGATDWHDLAHGSSVYSTSYTYDENGNILTLKRYDDAGLKMDDLSYTYEGLASGTAETAGFPVNNNRLHSVIDDPSSVTTNGRGDLEGVHSYTYDPIGNLTRISVMNV